jgi:transposase
MDRALLEECIAEGLSLAEIGQRVDRHESTVAYWMDKHGLRAVNCDRHDARGSLSREDLEKLVLTGASIAEIADKLDRSKATIRHWLVRYGLSTHRTAGRRASAAARDARGAGLSEVPLACPRHGLATHVREGRGYFRCRQCRQEAVVRRRRKVKEILVAEAGGCCQLCGYGRCPAALQFHHVDPETKQFGIAEAGMARSLDRLRIEVRKCVLLCSNCHAEVERGVSSLSGIAQMGDPG